VVARRSRHNPSESAWFGPNLGPTHRARRHAETFSGRLHRPRTLSHGRVTRSADLGVKGSRVQISPARLEISLTDKGFEEITGAS
jgi:hypothetical protein